MRYCRIVTCCLTLVYVFFNVQSTKAQEPSFINKEGLHEVNAGQTVELPCQIANLGEYSVTWTKAPKLDEPLFVDRNKLDGDERIELVENDENNFENFDLHISQVAPIDDGDYFCEIHVSSEKKLTQKQTLSVQVPSSVQIAPDKNPYIVKIGDAVSLQCYPTGNPMPRVEWTKIGGLLPDNRPFANQVAVHFPNANRSHEGIYRCTARNGVVETSSAEIKVVVISLAEMDSVNPPSVFTNEPLRFEKVGSTFNISCSYTASPTATVKWFFNKYLLELQLEENRNRMFETHAKSDNYSVVTLTIQNSSIYEFGDYACRVTNNMGENAASVHVTHLPGPAEIKIREKGPELTWQLRSAAPVLEYKVEYRIIGEDHFKEFLVPNEAKDNEDSLYEGSYIFSNLQPNKEYEIIVRGRNENGWGKSPLKSVFFRTDGHQEVAQPGKEKEQPEKGKTPSVKDEEKGKGAKGTASGLLSKSFIVLSLSVVSVTLDFLVGRFVL